MDDQVVAAAAKQIVDRVLPNGAANTVPEPPKIARGSRGGDFLAGYRPISYTIEGVLPSGYLYGLTARRGGGKTAYLIAASIAVMKGDPSILGCEVRQGRVAYIAKENPDDFRMKLAVNCYLHNIDHTFANDRLFVLDGRTDSPESIIEALKINAEEYGQFQLVCYDTFQAGFAASGGEEFNSNAEVLKFILRLRPIAEIIGKPSVLLAFHPTKNAGEDDLVPYGGGAIMNEVDGNLTLWVEAPHQIKFSWNRVRGPEFEPQYFRIEKISFSDIVDIKGRQILLPTLRPTNQQAVEERTAVESKTDIAFLRALMATPEATQRDLAQAVGLGVGAINKKIQRLKKTGMVEPGLAGFIVTKKAIRLLNSIP